MSHFTIPVRFAEKQKAALLAPGNVLQPRALPRARGCRGEQKSTLFRGVPKLASESVFRPARPCFSTRFQVSPRPPPGPVFRPARPCYSTRCGDAPGPAARQVVRPARPLFSTRFRVSPRPAETACRSLIAAPRLSISDIWPRSRIPVLGGTFCVLLLKTPRLSILQLF